MVLDTIFATLYEDFDHFYSRRRLAFHFLFWISLLSIYTVDILLVNPGFNFNISFVVAMREVLTSIFAFYFICYIAIPRLFMRGKYFVSLIAFLIPFVLAPLLNYFTFITLNPVLLQDKVSVEYVSRGLFVENFQSSFTIRPIILSFMPLLLRTMLLRPKRSWRRCTTPRTARSTRANSPKR